MSKMKKNRGKVRQLENQYGLMSIQTRSSTRKYGEDGGWGRMGNKNQEKFQELKH